MILNLIWTLYVLIVDKVAAKSPHLFGTGCIIQNENLVVSDFKALEEVKDLNSYVLDFRSKVVLNQSEADWEPYYLLNHHPGFVAFINNTNKLTVFNFYDGLFRRQKEAIDITDAEKIEHTENFDEVDTDVSDDPNISFNKQTNISSSTLYLDHLSEDIKQGVIFDNHLYILDDITNFTPIGNYLDVITILDDRYNRASRKTTGDVPRNRVGLSVTMHRDNLYLTGGEDSNHPDDGNSIYVLNLKSLVWRKHSVSGFSGARSGCLACYRGYLIHAFGMREGSYLSTTQFVDTETWAKSNEFNPDNNFSNQSLLVPILSSVFGGFFLLLFILGFYLLRKRHQKKKFIPPKYMMDKVWAEPKLTCFEMDTKLESDDPLSSFETLTTSNGSRTTPTTLTQLNHTNSQRANPNINFQNFRL